MTDEQELATRLRRLEQQVRSFRDLHTSEVGDLATKLDAMVKLHADELELILDQLGELAAEMSQTNAESQAVNAADPAASSPKRAKWLAEQERKKAPVTRRGLLLGRGDPEEPGSPAG